MFVFVFFILIVLVCWFSLLFASLRESFFALLTLKDLASSSCSLFISVASFSSVLFLSSIIWSLVISACISFLLCFLSAKHSYSHTLLRLSITSEGLLGLLFHICSDTIYCRRHNGLPCPYAFPSYGTIIF